MASDTQYNPGTRADNLTAAIFSELIGVIAKNASDKAIIEAQERVQKLIYRELKK